MVTSNSRYNQLLLVIFLSCPPQKSFKKFKTDKMRTIMILAVALLLLIGQACNTKIEKQENI